MHTLITLLALVAGTRVAFASVYPTAPVANTAFTAGQPQTIRWIDDGNPPSLDKWDKLRIELCGNGDVSARLAPVNSLRLTTAWSST